MVHVPHHTDMFMRRHGWSQRMRRRAYVSQVLARRRRAHRESIAHNTANRAALREKYAQQLHEYRRKVPQKEIMPKSLVNKQANRSVHKNKGKLKNVRKHRTVHVSKSLTEKIQKVTRNATTAYGEFRTVRTGFVGFYVGRYAAADSGTRKIAINNLAGEPYEYICIYPGIDIGQTAPCYFSNLFGYTNNSATVSTSQSQDRFLFFHPLKIWDAASVLWNNKSPNYVTTVGNLDTSFTAATAAETELANSLKIEVVNSYVTLEFKNVCSRDLKVTVFEYTPKLKFVKDMPLTNFFAAADEQQDAGGVNKNFKYYTSYTTGAAPTVANIEYALVFAPGLKPTKIPGFQYQGKTHEMIIHAQEICSVSIQGPKNVTLDFDKLMNPTSSASGFTIGSNAVYNSAIKGWSVNCMIKVELLPNYGKANFVNGNDYSGHGRVYCTSATPGDGTLAYPVQVTMRETFKLRCPQIAGFVDADNVAGDTQLLNLRKDKYVYCDLSQAQSGGSAPTYEQANEENPNSLLTGSLIA